MEAKCLVYRIYQEEYSNDFNLMGMISTSIIYSILAVRERENFL